MPASTATDHHQDDESVRIFFDQWHIYEKVVKFNYLFHREAFAAIGETLAKIPAPFSFIDLGAGDAAWTSRVLPATKVKSYEAVDLSAVALDCARKNLETLSCPKQFTQTNFFEYVKQARQSYDVAFIGLSLHHLPLADKTHFFSEIRRIIADGGRFLFYEPVLEPQDTCRDDMLNRWWQLSVVPDWKEMTGDELEKIHDHVFGNDYPETPETFCALAIKGGFSKAQLLTGTPGNFYDVIECLA